MTLNQILLISSGICIIGGFIALFKPKKKKKRKDGKPSKLKNWIYNILSRIPLLSNYLNNIRQQIYAYHFLDEMSLKQKTVNIIVNSLFVALGLFAGFFFIFEKNLYNLLINAFISGIFYQSLVRKQIGNDEKILEDLVESLKDIKQEYADCKIIVQAFIEARKEASHDIKMHLDKIIEILNQPKEEAEKSLKDYYKNTANKFFKILLAYSYFTKQAGDVEIGYSKESLFHRNINFLIREVRNEYRKRKNIKDKLFGQKMFLIMPLLILPLLKWFAVKFFTFLPELKHFYSSSIGYMDMLICALISIFLYLMYDEVTMNKQKHLIHQTNIFHKLASKKIINKILDKIVPRNTSKKYIALREIMIKAGKLEDMHVFYLKKLLLGAGVCIISFAMIKLSYGENLNRIIESTTYGIEDDYYLQNIDEMANPAMQNEKSINELDQKIIKDMQTNPDINNDEELLKSAIETKLEAEENIIFNDLQVERIYQKLKEVYKKNSFIMEYIFIAILSIIAYKLPNLNLQVNAIMQDAIAKDEVLSLQVVIMLLIHHEQTTLDMVLQWMIWFSNVFYQPLVEAKNKLSQSKVYENFLKKEGNEEKQNSGGVDALQYLKSQVDNKEFKRLIKSLIKVKQGTELREAFASLEQDQSFSEDVRKDNMEMVVETKVTAGMLISTASMRITLILYFLLPVMYTLLVTMLERLEYVEILKL